MCETNNNCLFLFSITLKWQPYNFTFEIKSNKIHCTVAKISFIITYAKINSKLCHR